MKYEQKFKIGMREIGLKNEITNYGVLAFLQDIATNHSDTVGYGVKDVFSKKRAWLLMDWEVEVIKRPKFNENVLVKTYAVKMDKPSFHCYRNFEIYNENKDIITTATSKWVLFDTEKNKIVKIDDEIMKLFNPEGNVEQIENKLLKIKEIPSYEKIYNYTVKRSDIDVVKHMNNLNYLKLAYEALPENIYFGEELNNFRIMYKHQIKLGDKVKCFYSMEKNSNYITIKSEDEKILHAIIELW